MSYLETITIAKGFSRKNGYKVEANQELIAIGLSNFFGSFVSAYPLAGSFSRSAVLSSTGVKTPLAGIFTAIIIIISLIYLTPALFWVPTSALAAMIICSSLPLFDWETILRLYKAKSWEFVVFLVSFLGCLFLPVQYGIPLSIVVSFMLDLYFNTQSGLKLEKSNEHLVAWSYKGSLFFLMANNFPEEIYVRSRVFQVDNVILDLKEVLYIDDSGLGALEETLELLNKNNMEFHLACVPPNILLHLERTEFTTRMGKKRIHDSIPEDPNESIFGII